MDKNKIIERFKRILKDLRTEKGLSQDEFAKELGISKGAVSYYETGQRVPDIVVLSAIADYFEVSTDFLLGRTETKSVNEDVQAACKVTGLSEEAIYWMKKNICSTFFLDYEPDIVVSDGYKRALSIINELFQYGTFWDWILTLDNLKETSNDRVKCIGNTGTNDIEMAGELLDVAAPILYFYMGDLYDKENNINYEERCDMLKYHAFCEAQKILEEFDLSDLRKTFTKEQWLDYLKIDEKTLQDLKKKSEEFKQGQQKKAGD